MRCVVIQIVRGVTYGQQHSSDHQQISRKLPWEYFSSNISESGEERKIKNLYRSPCPVLCYFHYAWLEYLTLRDQVG